MKLRNILVLLLALVFIGPPTISLAETLIKTEKFELHRIVYKQDGYKILCHWIQNPKLLSGKVNTGLSCVAIPDPEAVFDMLEPSPLQENKGPHKLPPSDGNGELF